MADYDIFTDEHLQYNEGLQEEERLWKSSGLPAHEDMYEQQTYIEY